MNQKFEPQPPYKEGQKYLQRGPKISNIFLKKCSGILFKKIFSFSRKKVHNHNQLVGHP
jgi:hypothetical protein